MSKYAASHLPDYLRAFDAYKTLSAIDPSASVEQFTTALRDAFLAFDATLLQPQVRRLAVEESYTNVLC